MLARRIPFGECQSFDVVGTVIFQSSNFISGLGELKCILGGIFWFSNDNVALMIPARPEAPSRWPMFVFTLPTFSGCSLLAENTAPMARVSRGSPAAVPVPWASTIEISELALLLQECFTISIHRLCNHERQCALSQHENQKLECQWNELLNSRSHVMI